MGRVMRSTTLSSSKPVKRRTRKPARAAGSTYDRFLDATEALFAQHGYEATTIRGIAQESACNLGDLHRYWGNKAALFADMLKRAFQPLDAKRQLALDALTRKEEKGEPVPVEAVLDAFIRPALIWSRLPRQGGVSFRQLFSRALTEPASEVVDVMAEIFVDSSTKFLTLLGKHARIGDPEAFYWRVSCVIGAFIFTQFDPATKTKFFGSAQPADWERALHEIVSFLAAGLRAPISPG